MQRDDIDWERLDRYVRGDGTPEELELLGRWVAADPERRALAAAMRTVGRPTGAEPRDWNERAAWHRVRRRMPWYGRAAWRASGPALVQATRWWSQPARLTAAALLVVVGSSVAIVRRGRDARSPVAAAPAEPMREVATRRGQRAVLDLADGSRVVLGAESRLRISPSPDASGRRAPRDLYLEGEGYFEVRHDSTRPFRVHTASGVAEDLGTEFVVTAYPETKGMRVVVASGEVALRTPDAPDPARQGVGDRRPLLTLGAGDLARLDTAGTATLTRDVDIGQYVARAQGRLVFDGTPLRDAVTELGRWYDLEIQLSDSSIAHRRLVATFGDEPAGQVLDRIALALGLTVERHGHAVRLAPRRAR